MQRPIVGIIGAGKLGVTIAQLALAAGYKVYISGSGSASEITLSTSIITPGAIAVTTDEAIEKADIVILALPLGKFHTLNPTLFKNKLVIDGMNHWFEVDGPLNEIVPAGIRTSEMVQERLQGAAVVKTLNHMGYHHLRDEARPKGHEDRKAIAVAGNDTHAVQRAADFVDDLGFDPLIIGTLDLTGPLEAGEPAFGANLPLARLGALIRP